ARNLPAVVPIEENREGSTVDLHALSSNSEPQIVVLGKNVAITPDSRNRVSPKNNSRMSDRIFDQENPSYSVCTQLSEPGGPEIKGLRTQMNNWGENNVRIVDTHLMRKSPWQGYV